MNWLKAHIERKVASRRVAIWLFHRGPGEAVVYSVTGEVQDRLTGGEDFGKPTLELDQDAFEVLIAAGADFLPPSAAVSRHLDDAIQVRDRLLTLVEERTS